MKKRKGKGKLMEKEEKIEIRNEKMGKKIKGNKGKENKRKEEVNEMEKE